MGTHARLSASNAYRWMACPGSVRLCESIQSDGRGSSVYAREGSAAHAFGEWLITNDLTDGPLDPDDFIGVGAVLEIPAEDNFEFAPAVDLDALSKDPNVVVWPIDEDMADAVSVYLEHIRFLRSTANFAIDVEYIEKNLDMTWLHPDFGGTGDHILARSFGRMHVTDYKHGRGVVVEVVDNEQGLKYGVGARHLHPEVDEVEITIVQPRAAHPDGPVRSAVYTRAQLDEFEQKLVDAAEEVGRPNAPLRAGNHCKFCGALAICPEAREEAERQAAADFADDPDDFEQDDVKVLSREQLGENLKWVEFLEGWCKAVEGEGLLRLRAGRSVPGQKLVRKGTNRRLTEEADEVVRRLKKAKVLKADCFKPPVLKTPAQLEKTGPNRALTKSIVADMTEKPLGETTIAHDMDPRPAVEPDEAAAEDFPDD